MSVAVRIIRIGEPRYPGNRIGPGDFTCEVDEHGAQVAAVAEQTRRAGTPRKQESEDVLVGFLDIARRAGEHEVVAAIVRGLSAARGHVVERDRSDRNLPLAVRTDRPVPVQQPLACLVICVAARG